ncbi:hypothetical protein VTN77DRAFT_3633 [Rasamsonia byssochlamydoides]|uniref:uncharacterized protein n=1 Tax=Rasamsonia byssochlamydoides TaxID=89139 RepID=UPI003742FB9D
MMKVTLEEMTTAIWVTVVTITVMTFPTVPMAKSDSGSPGREPLYLSPSSQKASGNMNACLLSTAKYFVDLSIRSTSKLYHSPL